VTDTNAKNNTVPGSLRESLLRDALSRAVDSDPRASQSLLNNLETFVEVVFYQGYSSDLLLCKSPFP
jgi:hypothetical protein